MNRLRNTVFNIIPRVTQEAYKFTFKLILQCIYYFRYITQLKPHVLLFLAAILKAFGRKQFNCLNNSPPLNVE